MAKKHFKPKPIAAVAYLRKSSKGNRSDGRERQEKSIPQQKREIVQLAKGRYQVKADIDWYADPGIPGWKRGAQRPDFQRMLARAQERHDFEAILCDNIDRFSRASVDEVQEDVLALKRAGVRWIVTAAQGTFDLGRSGHDIGEIMKFVVAVWSSHEYSRQLGRRVALARRNKAMRGLRSGGAAPYGFANNGKGGLRWGDPDKVKIVRMIFDLFGNQLRSMCGIAVELNRQKIPTSRGGLWWPEGVREILQRREYAGAFSYGHTSRSQFFRCNDEGEIVEVDGNGVKCSGKLFPRKNVYKPIIPMKLFDAVQRRLAGFAKTGRRPRNAGYALTGILVCDHCGKGLIGSQHGRQRREYRCPTQAACGTCKNSRVHEDAILPFVMRVLGEEIDKVRHLLISGPVGHENDEVFFDKKHDRVAELEKELSDITSKIEKAAENLMYADARTRSILDRKVKELWMEHDRIVAEQGSAKSAGGHTAEDLRRLREWCDAWKEFTERAVHIPLDPAKFPNSAAYHAEWTDSEPFGKLVDPRLVNEALSELGCEVRLRWKTEQVPTRSGSTMTRHRLVRGRLRLGQRDETITGTFLSSSAS